MDVGVDGSSLDGLEVGQLYLLANLGNLVSDAVTHFAAFEFHVEHLFLGGEVFCHGVVEDVGGECHEVGIGGHEVGLAAQHDDSTVGAVALGQHAAFVGVAVGTLGSHLLAFLAQEVDSFLKIAVALYEGFFAVHHAHASELAQLINLFCGDICHSSDFFC